ncbi:hypothetical protein ACWTU6_27065 [Mesorhizobium sp. BHbsci]
MCNACENYCCGSDEFGGCGCDGCPDPDCWSDDEDFFGDDDDFDCACQQRTGFECVQIISGWLA